MTLARGGAGHQVEPDTLEAFTLALRLGATGIETQVRALADGVPVLRRRDRVGPALRRKPLRRLSSGALPEGVVTLDALLDAVAAQPELVLHVGDQAAFDAVNGALESRAEVDPDRVWLAAGDLATLVEWRPRTRAQLLLVLGPRRLTKGAERLASDLRAAEIQGLGLFHQDWTAGHVATLHRFGRATFAWGAEHERELALLYRVGLDLISSEYPDRLAAVAAGYTESL